MLLQGREAVVDVQGEMHDSLKGALQRAERYVPRAARPPDVREFDASFFGVSADLARLMDPQHRLVLELCHEALDDAGYGAPALRKATGVFVGVGKNQYYLNELEGARKHLTPSEELELAVGNEPGFASSFVSYTLDLRGPSVTLDSACSTSLACIDYAIKSLTFGDCELALSAASVVQPSEQGYLYEEGSFLSPEGRCRVFDAQARGTVFASGAAAVLLKPLSAALADGDAIYGVIKAAALNNDGARKASFASPSVAGQAEVVSRALARGRIPHPQVRYLEAHGTGTIVGDPVEVDGLRMALTAPDGSSRYIGAVKANIGHLRAAAGLAGLVKALGVVSHRVVPPQINFTTENPEIDWQASRLEVNREQVRLPSEGELYAGVTALGIGGTNAHVIVGSAPPSPQRELPRDVLPLLLSAKTPTALSTLRGRYAELLRNGAPSERVCYTSAVGREHFAHRAAFCGRNAQELAGLLEAPERAPERIVAHGIGASTPRPLCFLFPGQGGQYPGLARALYDCIPAFGDALDECARLADAWLDVPLKTVLWGNQVAPNHIRYAQPALFSVQISLARTWLAFGISPALLLGHSFGEYAAACVAGVFSLEDAMKLVCARGHFMDLAEPGSMLAANLSSEAARRFIDHEVGFAAINGPETVVLSGPSEPLQRVQSELRAAGVKTRMLGVPRASHSSMMDPILPLFLEVARSVRFSTPQIPTISTMLGCAAVHEWCEPEYWALQIRNPADFQSALAAAVRGGVSEFLEVGPDATLTGMASACHSETEARFLHSLGGSEQPEVDELSCAAAHLYASGHQLDWQTFYEGRSPGRAHVPTYPYQRRVFWFGIDDMQSTESGEVCLGGPADSGLFCELRDASPWGRPELLKSALREKVAQSLQRTALDVSDTRSLFDMGFDSLKAVRLAQALRRELPVPIPATIALKYPTLEKLAAHLCELLEPAWAEAASVSSLGAEAEHGATDALAQLRRALGELS